MRDSILTLKAGQKKLDGEWMTLEKILSKYGGSLRDASAVVEELIASGHLKPYGERVFPEHPDYTNMILERTSKAKTIRR